MKTFTIISMIAAMAASTNLYAHGDHATMDHVQNHQITEVLYDNPAFNRGIHSYPNYIETQQWNQQQIFYVDKASGPAIYSYPERKG